MALKERLFVPFLEYKIIIFLLCLMLGNTVLACQDDVKGYQFGVFPHIPPSNLIKVYSPLAKDFAQKLNKKVTISTKDSFTNFMKELKKESYDIAYVQPFDYIWAHDKYNYEPLAARAGKLSAILIVNKDSDIKSIKDIKGKTIINPPKVAAVTILTTATLKKFGLDPNKDVKRLYGRSHFTCMQQVLIGAADVCGTAPIPLKHFEKHKMANRFRIIYESESIPHSLYVVHKRVPEADQKILRKTILGWSKSKAGRRMLNKSNLTDFVEVDDLKYNIVREMRKNSIQK